MAAFPFHPHLPCSSPLLHPSSRPSPSLIPSSSSLLLRHFHGHRALPPPRLPGFDLSLSSFPSPSPSLHSSPSSASPIHSFASTVSHFNPDHLKHDALCTISVLGVSYVWIKLFDIFVENSLIDQKLSRKLVHISTGVMYVMLWPIFSTSPWSRFFAFVIPFTNILKLIVYGVGIVKDNAVVMSISRTGASKELLRGPLYYVLALSICTLLFWRESPVGMVALAIMCGGDGIADIIGRRMGGVKLPHNPNKSWAGSISMFVFGSVLSTGFLYYYSFLGFYHLNWQNAIQSVAAVSLVATIVESLPASTALDDNITVPCTAILLGSFIFPAALL